MPKRSERNKTQAISLIQSAIALLDDFASEQVRSHLLEAVRQLQHVAKKQVKRNAASEKYLEVAKNNYKNWLETIRKNVADATKLELELKEKEFADDQKE